jgi:predicted DNA-binding protein with PD1-like motif
MKTLPLRLNPGDDLRRAVEDAASTFGAGSAVVVIAGIGSLAGAQLRFAGRPEATAVPGDLEILTLSGTVAGGSAHLHASISDADGRVLGGHVAAGCMVRTTAELLLALLPDWEFARRHDEQTGHPELQVRPKSVR